MYFCNLKIVRVTNNTKIDDPKVIDILMSMYNLKEYSGTYSKTSESL